MCTATAAAASPPAPALHLEALRAGDHLCCLFESDEEHHALLAPFLRRGLEAGEKVIYIADSPMAENVCRYMGDGQVVGPALHRGQFVLLTPDQAYLRNGFFDPEAMLGLFRSETERALAEGYPVLRVCGETYWSLSGRPGCSRLIEYESKLNQFFRGAASLALCEYDRRRVPADVLQQVLETHPLAVVDSRLYDNFYYVPPEEYLREDSARAVLERSIANLAERQRLTDELRRGAAELESRVRERTEEIQARARQQAAVAQLGLRALSGCDLPELFQDACTVVAGTLDVEFSKVLELQPDGSVLRLAAGVGWQEGLAGAAIVDAGRNSQAGFTLLCGEPVLVTDLRAETRFQGPALLHQHGVVSGVSAVIRGKEQPFGVLGAHTSTRRSFTAGDADFMQAVANVLAAAILRRHSEGELDRFFTLSLDLLCIAGTDGYFKRVNPAFEQILGYKNDELLRRPFLEFVHPDDRARTLEEVRKLSAGEPTVRFENRYRCTDGSYKWLMWTAAPEGKVLYATARDLTERKVAEELLRQQKDELARSNAELQQFAYVASHDLQEPLRMVANFTKLLARRYRDRLDARADQYIDFAVDGANRMSTLIDSLLQYSRVDTRATPLQPLPLAQPLRNALANLRIVIAETAADVTSGPLPTVPGDEAQLTRVFQNLIANGIRFRSAARPRIHISARDAGEQWEVSVSDNGIGMDPAHCERVFRMFQRLHPRAEYPGTGMGLTICRKIIERHGGSIRAESTAGAGATFIFTLPKNA